MKGLYEYSSARGYTESSSAKWKVIQRVSCDIWNERSRRVELSPEVFRVHWVQNANVTRRVSCYIPNERLWWVKFSPTVILALLVAFNNSKMATTFTKWPLLFLKLLGHFTRGRRRVIRGFGQLVCWHPNKVLLVITFPKQSFVDILLLLFLIKVFRRLWKTLW
jgi:hypothetical protein